MDPVTYTLARGASSNQALYVEDVFSTQFYSGNATEYSVNNGLNLSLYGGLVWTRTTGTADHVLVNNVNGLNQFLSTNTISGARNTTSEASGTFTFTSSGYKISGSGTRLNSITGYVSWSFRKAPKFFDIVTYTGNGTSQSIPHDLQATPGFIAVKRTDASGSWVCWHQDSLVGLPSGYFLLESTSGLLASPSYTGFPWNLTFPTSTGFSVGSLGSSGVPSGHLTNISGAAYVAYIFANGSEGGFGEDGTESIIKCGTYTVTGANPIDVDMGFEPGFILSKTLARVGVIGTLTGNTLIVDNVNPFSQGTSLAIVANSQDNTLTYAIPYSSGFYSPFSNRQLSLSGCTYVYVAIRKGLMRPPTTSTGVYAQRLQSASLTPTFVDLGIKADLFISNQRNSNNTFIHSRVVGTNQNIQGYAHILTAPSGSSGTLTSGLISWQSNSGVNFGSDNSAGFTFTVQRNFNFVHYIFGNAGGFFDLGFYRAVSGAGNGTRTIRHNLRFKPELLITHDFSSNSGSFYVYSFLNGTDQYLLLNGASGLRTLGGLWGGTQPTKTGFTVDTTIVATTSGLNSHILYYAFASCPGVSKVGSYTGTSADLNVDCGFTNGVKFLLVKRVDESTSGDWYIWDTARGIVPSSDPYSRWNLNTGEVANTDFIDTYSPGFTVTSSASGTVNISGAVYLFLAIA